MEAFLTSLSASHYGDLASVIGVIISIVGFVATLINVARARSASKRAEDAATAVKKHISLFDTAVDFTLAINTLEEIKRFHRFGEWSLLPDRYAATRKFLINLRHSSAMLSEAQLSVIQGALANLTAIESRVEQGLQSGSTLKSAKFNAILSADIDGLIATLAEVKATEAGV